MEIRYDTKDLKEMTDIYELAKSIFHHLNHENIEIDFELESDSVTLSWSSKPEYQDYMKLELLNNLIDRFTSYREKVVDGSTARYTVRVGGSEIGMYATKDEAEEVLFECIDDGYADAVIDKWYADEDTPK